MAKEKNKKKDTTVKKEQESSAKDLNTLGDIPNKLKAAVFARKNALFPRAEEILFEILKETPQNIDAQKELVTLYFSTEHLSQAEAFLIRIEKDAKEKPWILFALLEVYRKQNLPQKQIATIKQLLDIQFNEKLARRLFDLQKIMGDIAGALSTIMLLRTKQDHIDLESIEAQLKALLGKHDDAKIMCEALLERDPIPQAAIELFISLHLGVFNDPEAVIRKFEPMLQLEKTNPMIFVALSKAYHRMERYNEAFDYINKALAMEDNHPEWWYDISLMYRQTGRLKESQDCLMKSIRLNPLNPTAIRVYGVEQKYVLGEEAHQQLNFAHAHEHIFKDTKKVELYMALAKAYEDFDELKTAFKYYEIVSRLQAKLKPYKHSETLNLLKMTRDRITPMTYKNFKFETCQSEKPVFVLGMPRSGTSLVEQVIASHSQAHGAGELKLLHRILEGVSINNRILETKPKGPGVIPTFIKDIDLSKCRHLSFKERGELYVKGVEALAELSGKKEVLRIVDKMPGNYFWAGIIPFILPNAKIIHTERHPLDNCLSLYRIFFPDGMPWSYDLTNLGKTYRACYDHMRYWQSNLPQNSMITVNYEVMVNDFENQTKNIISHIGLPWEEACLKFYETDRQVKTASLNQVRKPIYGTSVGRWKKYEAFLKPLIIELGPVIKEYEDMIDSKLNQT